MFKLKSKVMPIHNASGHTVCTPDGFALKARCERLKRELKANRALTGV